MYVCVCVCVCIGFGRSKHIGFINDITRICEKYGLMRFINTLKHIGTFPTAYEWKTIVKRSVDEYNNNAWLSETATDDFSRLRSVQQSMNKPAVLWTTALRFPAILHKFAFLVRLLTLSFVADPFLKTCVKCNLDYSDPVDHFFNVCIKTQPQRELFWQRIQSLPIEAETELNNLSDREFSSAMLGAPLYALNKSENGLLLFMVATSWYTTEAQYC